MSVFFEPPFWATGRWGRPLPLHGVAVLTVPPTVEPLTLAQGKLRAGLDWADGDPRDDLMLGFIQTARARVEKDTGVALPLQTYQVRFDNLPWGRPIVLPWRPVVSATVSTIDLAGVTHVLDPSVYVLDPSSVAPVPARLGFPLSTVFAWPTDLRTFQPWLLEIVVGLPDVPTLQAQAPELVHAVGLLTAHYATVGRDIAAVERVSGITVPYGYEDAIASYVIPVVA